VYETENSSSGALSGTVEAFISLPALFRQSEIAAPHGLVLKTLENRRDSQEIELPAVGEGRPQKTILLAPKIDIELEIPEESIYRLPEVFAGLYSYFFKGAFIGAQDMILILNPEKIVEGIR
jgi:hypothetical protein